MKQIYYLTIIFGIIAFLGLIIKIAFAGIVGDVFLGVGGIGLMCMLFALAIFIFREDIKSGAL